MIKTQTMATKQAMIATKTTKQTMITTLTMTTKKTKTTAHHYHNVTCLRCTINNHYYTAKYLEKKSIKTGNEGTQYEV